MNYMLRTAIDLLKNKPDDDENIYYKHGFLEQNIETVLDILESMERGENDNKY